MTTVFQQIISLFLFSIISINCNLWDNIYSNANSPQTPLPDNFELDIFNEIDNSIAGILYASTSLNLFKFSFILDENNSADNFTHILIDFNNSKIYFDTEEKCAYKEFNLLSQISAKFILNAYDLFSYCNEDEESYHYVVVNPLELTEVDQIKNVIFNNFLNEKKSIYDKAFYADFIVDKGLQKLVDVKIRSSNSISSFKTSTKIYEVELEKFNLTHNISECVEYKES